MHKLLALRQPAVFSLSDVIAEIFSSQQIAAQRPLAGDIFSLLELLCQAGNLSEEKSYRYLAEKSGFPFVSKLHLPAEESLRHAAFALDIRSYIGLASFFRKRFLLPQQSLDGVGCVLLAADPGIVKREFSYTPNIPVYLAEHSKIAAVWSLYDSLFHSKDDSPLFERAIKQLSREAYSRGAQEVFIWKDTLCRYEYFVFHQRFFGEIAYGVLEGLFKELPYRSSVRISDEIQAEVSILVKRGASLGDSLLIMELSSEEQVNQELAHD